MKSCGTSSRYIARNVNDFEKANGANVEVEGTPGGIKYYDAKEE